MAHTSKDLCVAMGLYVSAFFIMLFFGSYKYVDRVVALHRASFAKIHCSNKEKKLRRISIEDKGRSTRDNDDVLLDAHGILGVAMAAFADYKVNSGGYQRSYSDWKDLSKVVEMEASLMYDIYTKATVIHTWGGYYHPCPLASRHPHRTLSLPW